MNKQSLLNVTVIALAMTLSVACSKKDDSSSAAAGTVTAQEKTAEEKLNEVFQQIEGKFDASDLTLANQIKGIDLVTSRSNVSANGAISDGPAKITVWLLLEGGLSPVKYESDALVWRDLGDSVVTLKGADADLAVKVKCLDEGCTTTGVLVVQYPTSAYKADNNDKALMAGYIFSNNSGERLLSVSVGKTVGWEQAMAPAPAPVADVEQK